MDIKIQNKDLVFENNNLVIIEKNEFIKQILTARLRTLLGECIYDTNLGIPYLEEILGKKRSQNIVEDYFKKVILETPGVIKLIKFDLEFNVNTRELTITFDVQATDGIITINEEVEI